MKNVLVIHPKDETTDFLCQSYNENFTVVRTELSKSILSKLIRCHDIIIFMGHGDENGLFGFGRYYIDSTFIDDLRKKQCICVWCYASDFVKKYKLKSPFSTGMFISEVDEAYLMGVRYSDNQISDSNDIFTTNLKTIFEHCTELKIFKKLIKTGYINKHHYGLMSHHGSDVSDNPIINFNAELFYSNE